MQKTVIRKVNKTLRQVRAAHAQVKKAKLEHNGLYSCHAENLGGSRMTQVVLYVHVKPKRPCKINTLYYILLYYIFLRICLSRFAIAFLSCYGHLFGYK